MRDAPHSDGWARNARPNLVDQPVEIRQAHDHRCHHDRVNAGTACGSICRRIASRSTGQARDIACAARPAPAQRLGKRPRPARRNGRVRLVGQSMIVLDVVDAAIGKPPGQVRELLRRQALRLERRAGQRPPARPHPPAQFIKPVPRPAERDRDLRRKFRIVQHHIVMDRRIAEQHIEKLPGVGPDGRDESEMRTSNWPADSSRIFSTRPTISDSTNSSSMAVSGISTLCSTAIAFARSSIDRASLRMW